MADTDRTERCGGCGGRFVRSAGPTHAYLLSSPGCWAAYGEILAREYGDQRLFKASHRYTADAYALQHPGDDGDIRQRRSVWLHYIALYAVLERGETFDAAKRLMQRYAKHDFEPVNVPHDPFGLTVRDVLDAGPGRHETSVRRWAECAFEAWSELREPTRRLLAIGSTSPRRPR